MPDMIFTDQAAVDTQRAWEEQWDNTSLTISVTTTPPPMPARWAECKPEYRLQYFAAWLLGLAE